MHTCLGKGRHFSHHKHLFPFVQRLCGHGQDLERTRSPRGIAAAQRQRFIEEKTAEEVVGFG